MPRSFIGETVFQKLGIKREEVHVQQLGDLEQQLRVDAVAVKNPVASGSVDVELLGEPHHAAPLLLQLLLYEFANLDGFADDAPALSCG